MGSSRSGHAWRLPIGRIGCARAIVGSAWPASAQRPTWRNSFVGHAEDRRAGGARGALLVRALGAVGSAPAAAATICAPTAECGAASFTVMVATGRIACFADLPRAGGGRPPRAGNGGSAAAAAGGAPSSTSTMEAARGRRSSTITATAATTVSTGAGSGCR